MPFSPPTYTPFPWADEPSTSTPVDSANLDSFGSGLATYTTNVVSAYDAFAEAQFGASVGTYLNVTIPPYNIKGDGNTASDGAMSSSVTPTKLATAAAASMTVGMKVYVRGAGAAGVTLITSVSALIDSTHVTLANAAATTVSGAQVVYGTDNNAGFVTAAATGRTLFFPNPTPGTFYLFDTHSDGSVALTFTQTFLRIVGESRDLTILRLGPEGATAQDHVFFQVSGARTLIFQDITLQGQDFLGNGGPPSDPGAPTGKTRNYGISHGGSAGEVRLTNVRLKNFVSGCGINATNSVAGIWAEFCHFQGYGSTYRSIPLGATEGSSSAWTSTKRVRCHGCNFSDFGDPTGGNLYHAIYVSTGWALDLEQCYFHTPSSTSTGNVIQHTDGYVTLATAAPVSRFVGCDFGPDLGGMPGILTSYNTETSVIGCTFNNLEGSSVVLQGPALIDNCTFISPSDFAGRTIATAIQAQATGLTWNAAITNCRWRGATGASGPNAIGILNSSSTSEFKVRGCDFTGFSGSASAGYLLIFGSSAVVGGHVDIVDCDFSGNPGYNIQAGSMSTAMRLSVRGNRFYTADGTTIIKTTTTALAFLAVKGNEFSQVTATDAFGLSVAPTASDVDNQGGSAGYKTVNGALSTTTPGAVTTLNIAHGLGNANRTISPTKISVQAGDTNAKGAPTYFVTATTTNVVLNFTSALTAATAYTWNWRAEA